MLRRQDTVIILMARVLKRKLLWSSSIFSFKPQIHFIKNDTNAAHVVTVLIGLVWLIIQRGSSMKQQSLKIMFLKDK